MRWKYRFMITSFSGNYKPDQVDVLLLNLKKMVKRIEKMLRDQSQCEFIPVCIPEAMAINETHRLLADLEKAEIIPRQMIVNHVMNSEGCDFCKLRKISQQKYLEKMNISFNDLNRVEVPEFAHEVKGMESLLELKNYIFNQTTVKT